MKRGGAVAGVALMAAMLAAAPQAPAAARKTHAVVLGVGRKVPYSKDGDPAGAGVDEKSLTIRALVVDGVRKEWTTGEAHDVTPRSFVVRRAVEINDTLPGDKKEHWVWQRGPWLLADRATGHVTALKLADYDPAVSQVSWFRDYAAYCGTTASAKSLYAVVVQVEAHRPVLAKKLGPYDAASHAEPVCGEPDWQREPMRVTFHPTGKEAVSYDITPGSAVLVEDEDRE